MSQEQDLETWTSLHAHAGQLAMVLWQTEGKADAWADAVAHLQQALSGYSSIGSADAVEWIHEGLGLLYSDPSLENDPGAIEQAIHHYSAAATAVRDRDAARFAWFQARLAEVLLRRPSGDDAAAAIREAEAGLAAGAADDRETLGDLEYVLGDAYWEMVRRGSMSSVDEAIVHFERALMVWDEAPAERRFRVHFALGTLYGERQDGDAGQDHNASVAHLAAAVQEGGAFPHLWPDVALQLVTRITENPGRADPDDLERALVMADELAPYIADSSEDMRLLEAARGEAYVRRGLQSPGTRSDDLEAGIGAYLRALALAGENADGSWTAFVHLRVGTTFIVLARGVDPERLSSAIGHLEEALAQPELRRAPARWTRAQNALGEAYRRWTAGDRAENLERSIAAHQAALSAVSRDTDPWHWVRAQGGLAAAFWRRIGGDRAQNVETAIGHAQAALDAAAVVDDPEMIADVRDELGSAYLRRVRGEPAENVEIAIAAYEEALRSRQAHGLDDDVTVSRANLGHAYSFRQRGERIDNIERALAYSEAALAGANRERDPKGWARDRLDRERDPEGWARLQGHLAGTYHERLAGDRAANIEEAIRHAKLALEVVAPEERPEEWAMTQDLIGMAYADRLRGDGADNIEQAIAAHRRGLEVYTRERNPIEWARVSGNLALALSQRVYGDAVASVEEAIGCADAALTVISREKYPDEWARLQNMLGAFYARRTIGDARASLDAAIQALQRALLVRTPARSPRLWAIAQTNLGGVYLQRAELGGGVADVEAALEAFHAALGVESRESDVQRWAHLYRMVGLAHATLDGLGRAGAAAQAIAHYEAALAALPVEVFPADRLSTARDLAELHFRHGQWSGAHDAYEEAVHAVDVLVQSAHTEVGRRSLVERSTEVFASDAYCLLRLDRPLDALVRLDRGKVRVLAEALALHDAETASLPAAERDALAAVRETVAVLEAEMRQPPDTPGVRAPAELGDLLREARRELGEAIERIRAAQPEFMALGLDGPGILEVARKAGALVAPVVTSHGGAVLVVPQDAARLAAAHLVELPALTSARLRAMLRGGREPGGWLGAYRLARSHPALAAGWRNTMAEVMTDLWETLVGPVVERLEALGVETGSQIVLLPQGGLGLLPLHAASSAKRPGGLLDTYAVAYAPSVFALHLSLRRAAEERRAGHRLLGVIDPTGDLRYAVEEGVRVADRFRSEDRHLLCGAEASDDAVVATATHHTHLHFACHGDYNWTDPPASGLRLADGRSLSLSDLLAHRLDLSRTRLVALSACETGLTEAERSPDEYVGLPAGFLAAGAPAVLSTLWAVDDFSSSLLMERFYEAHITAGLPGPEALRVAQRWLREMDFRELLKRLAEGRAGTEAQRSTAGGDPAGAGVQPSDRPFAHPYFWAAFTFTGA